MTARHRTTVVSDLALRGARPVGELVEVRPPDGSTTRFPYVTLEWCQRWPCEEIWKVRLTPRAP